MRRFVIGDIHGSFKALKQILEKSNFDYDIDQLICLGDIVDSWPDTHLCIGELIKIKNIISLKGNHDFLFLDYIDGNILETYSDDNFRLWQNHGGKETLRLYKEGLITDDYINFLASGKYYYEQEGNLFVHAGYNTAILIEENNPLDLLWDRTLVRRCYDNQLRVSIDDKYNEIFVGHTTLQSFNSKKFDPCIPQKWSNVWLMDTGCAFKGVLSLMNIDTKEIFTSEPSMKLYPDHKGRNDGTYNDILKLI